MQPLRGYKLIASLPRKGDILVKNVWHRESPIGPAFLYLPGALRFKNSPDGALLRLCLMLPKFRPDGALMHLCIVLQECRLYGAFK
jgi:hypothetical protein